MASERNTQFSIDDDIPLSVLQTRNEPVDTQEPDPFDSIRAEDDSDDDVHNARDSASPEMSDEDEFNPYSDDNDDDDDYDSSDDDDDDDSGDNHDANVNISVSAGADGSVAHTLLYPAKDGTVWNATPVAAAAQTPAANIVNLPRNRIPNTNQAITPADCFDLYISPDIIRDIVKYTNLEGVRQKGDRWVATDGLEIRALIGIIIYLGAQRQSKVNLVTIWTPLIGQDFCRATMSKNRVFALLSALRFDDKDTRRLRQQRDPLAPISDILKVHSANLLRYFVPGATLTVDEQLIPFRGRCSFIQYIPSKPAKYGLKLFWICDSETYYPLKNIVYCGKMSRIPTILGEGQGHQVVMELSLPFQGKGRNITMDNFFTDASLAAKLLNKKTTVIGTVRRNKRFLPQKFKGKKNLQQYQSLFGFTEKQTLVSYQGSKKQNVILLSTMHSNAVVGEGEQKKPEIVLDYNSTKGGVDTMDQMCLNYTAKRQTKRWPLVLFYNMLDTSIVAASVVYKTKNPHDKLSHNDYRAEFIRAVAFDLMKEHMLRRFNGLNTASRQLRTLMSDCLRKMGLDVANTPAAAAAAAPGGRKRARCGLCHWSSNKRGTEQCQRCDMFLCKDHKVVVKKVVCVNCRE